MKFERDIIAVVETNVDDTTGEVLARTIDRVTREGAYDVSVSTYYGKKGRIGQTIRAICSPDSVEKFAQILVEETGTLGVKFTEYTRLIVPRKEISVPVSIGNFRGSVSVRVADLKETPRIRPDQVQAREISESQKVPLRDVLELITVAAREYLSKQEANSSHSPAHSTMPNSGELTRQESTGSSK